MIALPRLLLIALLAWAGASLLAEVHRTRRACSFSEPPATFTDRWRMGSADQRQLAAFAQWIELAVPAGSRVAFRSWPEHRWIAWNAAYLLPHHELVPVAQGSPWSEAEYAAMFRGSWEHPDLELVFEHPDGRIYRIERR